jgi:hypothetical protein
MADAFIEYKLKEEEKISRAHEILKSDGDGDDIVTNLYAGKPKSGMLANTKDMSALRQKLSKYKDELVAKRKGKNLNNPPQLKDVDGSNGNPANDPIFKVLKIPSVFAMVGSPKSGKTWCMKHLLIHYLMTGELQFGIVFTGTKFSNQFDFITDSNMIISGFDERVLRSFLRKLKEYRLANEKPAKAFIVFDDMVGQVPWESSLLLHLCTTYRWYGLSVFISTQYIYKINPTIRTVCDYAFIWAQDSKRCYDAIYESFGLGFDDFKSFKENLDDIVSEQYWCMLYNKEKRNIEERYGGYKAPADIPEVKFQFSKPKDRDGRVGE